MKLHVLALIVLFTSSTYCFILERVGEGLHKIANAIVPHEHPHRHHEHCGHFGGHHHHHRFDEGVDSYYPPDSQENSDYRRGPGPRRPPHRYPEGSQERFHYFNSQERPQGKPSDEPNDDNDKKEESVATTTEGVMQIDTTTAGGEELEGKLINVFKLEC